MDSYRISVGLNLTGNINRQLSAVIDRLRQADSRVKNLSEVLRTIGTGLSPAVAKVSELADVLRRARGEAAGLARQMRGVPGRTPSPTAPPQPVGPRPPAAAVYGSSLSQPQILAARRRVDRMDEARVAHAAIGMPEPAAPAEAPEARGRRLSAGQVMRSQWALEGRSLSDAELLRTRRAAEMALFPGRMLSDAQILAARRRVDAMSAPAGGGRGAAGGGRGPGGGHGFIGPAFDALFTLDMLRMGGRMFGEMVKPASEYQREIALMNQSALTHEQRIDAIKQAWRTTGEVLTTTVAGNLSSIQELQQVFGAGSEGFRHALDNLSTIQRLQGLLGAYAGVPRGGDQAYTIAKALELRGETQTPADFQASSDLMAKAIGASRGKVTAEDFLSAFKYGRTAAQGWDKAFTYLVLPTLIQEMKGKGFGGSGMTGGPGNPLMSMYAAVVGGTISQKALKEWQQLGLLDTSKLIFSHGGTLRGVQAGGIKGWETFQRDPFEWVQGVLVPAMQAKGMGEAQERQTIQYLFPNRTAGFLATQMALQSWKFSRDIPLYLGQRGLAGFDQLRQQNPELARQALLAQWNNTLTRISEPIMTMLLPGMNSLADALQGVSQALGTHPEAARVLASALTGLGLSLGFSGAVWTLTYAFRALSGAMVLPALAGGGRALIAGEAAAGGAAAGAAGSRIARFLGIGRGAATATAGGEALALGEGAAAGAAGASVLGRGLVGSAGRFLLMTPLGRALLLGAGVYGATRYFEHDQTAGGDDREFQSRVKALEELGATPGYLKAITMANLPEIPSSAALGPVARAALSFDTPGSRAAYLNRPLPQTGIFAPTEPIPGGARPLQEPVPQAATMVERLQPPPWWRAAKPWVHFGLGAWPSVESHAIKRLSEPGLPQLRDFATGLPSLLSPGPYSTGMLPFGLGSLMPELNAAMSKLGALIDKAGVAVGVLKPQEGTAGAVTVPEGAAIGGSIGAAAVAKISAISDSIVKGLQVSLSGETNLTGTMQINMGELGSMVERFVARGLTRAMGSPASTGARFDGAALQPPT